MKKILYVSITVALFLGLAGSALAQMMGQEHFNKMKSLQGQWKGMGPDGHEAVVSYKLMSNGSALVETLEPAEEGSMLSVYHMDGDKLMMTHYCSAGNQPRMKADDADPDSTGISFHFMDATNLMSPSDGHMVGLKLVFVDNNHIQQIWTWSKNGVEGKETFNLERTM